MLEKLPLRSMALVALVLVGGCARPDAPEAPELPAPFEAREGFAPAENGSRLYYRSYGEGPDTLVLLHGGPGANFMGVGPDLLSLAADHALLMYDQRGGGRSDEDPNAADQTLETHVGDLEALRQHLGLERMTLIGHSWGCILAASYAAKHPEHVERLLLIGPMEPTVELLQLRRRAEEEIARKAEQALAELARREDLADDPVARCRAKFEIMQAFYYHDPSKMAGRAGDYCAVPPDVWERMSIIGGAIVGALGEYDLRPLLAKLEMPALVVEGAQSPLPLDGNRAWARSLPNARLWLIENVGHAYPFVEAPQVFFPGVGLFLEGVWPEGAVVEGQQP